MTIDFVYLYTDVNFFKDLYKGTLLLFTKLRLHMFLIFFIRRCLLRIWHIVLLRASYLVLDFIVLLLCLDPGFACIDVACRLIVALKYLLPFLVICLNR